MADIRAWTSRPTRSTTSFALHLKKTSPTNSASTGFPSGKCQWEWKVSVRAKCCSAITRRDILDRKMVFMNLSMSDGFIRSRHSNTPIANFGITVRCSCRVLLMTLHNLSLSSSVFISRTRRKLSNAL